MIGIQNRWQEDLFLVGELSDLIPEDHVLRRIDRVLDLSWLRALVVHALLSCYLQFDPAVMTEFVRRELR